MLEDDLLAYAWLMLSRPQARGATPIGSAGRAPDKSMKPKIQKLLTR